MRQGAWRNMFAFRSRPICPVWDVKFAPTGHYFCTGSHDNMARLWSVDHREPLRLFRGHLADVDCVSWHPNCHYVGTGSSDKTLRVWDVNTGECVRLFCGHLGGVNALDFCSSGRYIVSGGQDKLVIVWDFASGARVMALEGHTGPVWSVSVSPDYSFIATGCADGAVRVWDADKIWGKGSLAYQLAVSGQDAYSGIGVSAAASSGEQAERRRTAQALKNAARVPPACRSFPSKYTPVHFCKFQNERMLLAAGTFALPVMR